MKIDIHNKRITIDYRDAADVDIDTDILVQENEDMKDLLRNACIEGHRCPACEKGTEENCIDFVDCPGCEDHQKEYRELEEAYEKLEKECQELREKSGA